MKKEITLNVVKYTLGLVLFFMVSSCTDDLNSVEFNGLDADLVAQGADSRTAAKGGSGGVVANVTTWSTDFLTDGCVGVEMSFKLNGVGGREAKIAELVAGIYIPLVQKNASDAATVLEYKSTFNTPGSYTLYYQVGGQNGSNGFQSFTFVVENCNPPACVESFSYVSAGVNTYTFTYIPAEDMTNQLVVFTFAQAVAASGFDNTWSKNGQTMQKSMDFVACVTYTWTVTLVKDCNAGAPNNNVWTDFKVGGVSKKNTSTPTIVFNCN